VIDSPGAVLVAGGGPGLVRRLKTNLRQDIPVLEVDANVNDEEFSRQCAVTLLERMAAI